MKKLWTIFIFSIIIRYNYAIIDDTDLCLDTEKRKQEI